MRVDAACRMIPLLLDGNRDAADDDDEDSDNGSPATTVRAAWLVGVDWLESRG